MTNVKMEVKGKVLTITVNLDERHGRSSTGKTEIVATSAGAAVVPGFPAIKVGLNVFTK